jgi:hypothetical protein
MPWKRRLFFKNRSFQKQAALVRNQIMERCWNGRYFVDNLIRQKKRLIPTENGSEICQYHAFMSRLANPESHPLLWKHLKEDCGPLAQRKSRPLLEPANMIMGRYLRFELLSRYGYRDQLMDEIKATFAPMAERTGTLWEKLEKTASCNHGLAAHVAVSMFCHLHPEEGIWHVQEKNQHLKLSPDIGKKGRQTSKADFLNFRRTSEVMWSKKFGDLAIHGK